MVISGDTTVYK
ncbi:hypothetical protein PDE_04437 [Penicillium oxalicum 114-2]|uniref:Uncharacterized protein n=1 Tax=Penicillium oxalicum (strain 114-2 / CGMCC 5302) TaxID=933388 RepID=S8B4K6_PENO1|nr:hypothetical protein PDE_04437 [Penicillium oxalicum 114-2]